MLWFITLLVLALAAFFIIKAVKATAERRSADQHRLQGGSGLTGTLNHETKASTGSTPHADTSSAPDVTSTNDSGQSGNMAATATAGVAVAGAAAVAASGGNQHAQVAASPSEGQQSQVLNSGDSLVDAREMIKILNLAEPDAGRLAISREQFAALRSGDAAAAPSADQLDAVTDKLRSMLA